MRCRKYHGQRGTTQFVTVVSWRRLRPLQKHEPNTETVKGFPTCLSAPNYQICMTLQPHCHSKIHIHEHLGLFNPWEADPQCTVRARPIETAIMSTDLKHVVLDVFFITSFAAPDGHLVAVEEQLLVSVDNAQTIVDYVASRQKASPLSAVDLESAVGSSGDVPKTGAAAFALRWVMMDIVEVITQPWTLHQSCCCLPQQGIPWHVT